MNEYQMGAAETRFAEMVWESAPVSSTALVRRCEAELGWKKSTTYTVLKRLCGKGLFRNEGGTVTVLVSKEAFYACRSEQFVEETFGGSLPAFLAAFTSRKRLTADEIESLRRMVDAYEEG
ncbi:MAG: BlaI/MecI/CopY family transcriptional regulator [Oscillospiraceae bacterium]|nr:BlaI/MecI/CopY family transcriptional regulator [Oscillospiraceae bacterium]